MTEPKLTQEEEKQFIQFIIDRLDDADIMADEIRDDDPDTDTFQIDKKIDALKFLGDKEGFNRARRIGSHIPVIGRKILNQENYIKHAFITSQKHFFYDDVTNRIKDYWAPPIFLGWQKQYKTFFPNALEKKNGKFINNDDIPLIKEAIKKYNNEKKSKGGRKHKSRRRRRTRRRKSKKSRKSRRRRRKTRRRRR